MSIYVQVILLIINIINTVLHGLCVIVLTWLYKRSRSKVQQLYLITLVVCECCVNLLESSKLILKLTPFSEKYPEHTEHISNHMLIVQFCGFALVFYVDMIFITVDRFLEVWLNIKYPIYWNEFSTSGLLAITWLIAVITAIIVNILRDEMDFFWEDPFYKYVFPTTEFLFIFVAIFTYAYIFKKYKTTRIAPLQINSNGQVITRRQSGWEIFRKSRFYIPLMLILSYALFFVVADFIYLFTLRD